MKYKVKVIFSYIQDIEVEAADIDEARNKAFYSFDIQKAYKGEGEIYSTELIHELSASDLAFIDAYESAVGDAPKEIVTLWLQSKNHDKFYEDYSEYYSSITDAHEMWLMAQSFFKENSK